MKLPYIIVAMLAIALMVEGSVAVKEPFGKGRRRSKYPNMYRMFTIIYYRFTILRKLLQMILNQIFPNR